MSVDRRRRIDFFVSYTGADEGWAEWIAWQLKTAGFQVRIQKWHFDAGSDFLTEMDEAVRRARRTIAVLSPAYLQSAYCRAEWRTIFTTDVDGRDRRLVPVCIETCSAKELGLLGTRVYLDLTPCPDAESARQTLLGGLSGGEPKTEPVFPGMLKANSSSAAFDAAADDDGTSALHEPKPYPGRTRTQSYDVFLSYAHGDAEFVENIGQKLLTAGLNVWLDKWVLIPGDLWQQEMARGLEEASTCAVCIGQTTPRGWFQQEIQRALNRQANDQSFRVIPVILPNGNSTLVDDFVELRTWIEFKESHEDQSAFHLLVSGVKGIRPGPGLQQQDTVDDAVVERVRAKLVRVRALRDEKLIDEAIAQDAQRRLLGDILEM